MTHNTEVEENIKNALVPWTESFGTKETFDKVITAIDSLHRRVAELESLAYAVAVDIDSEGKIITHQQLQKAREQILSITAQAVEENTAFYEQKYGGNYEQCGRDIKFSIAQALDHSELDHLPDRPLNQERE